MVESASSAIIDSIANEKERVQAVLAAKMSDLPAAFNLAAGMVRLGY